MRLPDCEMALFQEVPFIDLPVTVQALVAPLSTLGLSLVAGRSLARERQAASGMGRLTAQLRS